MVLVIYREDHKFLLDPIIPKPGGTVANYDLVIASQPYRARASVDFKAKRVIAPLARALGPGGRLIAIHSLRPRSRHGDHPEGLAGRQSVHHDRHQILKAVKHELGPAGRDLNFNAYADNRSLFRYEMHTLPSEISESIGTSTAVRGLERGDLRGAGRGRPARRRGQRRPLSRRDARGAAQARRAVVLRRVLRDLAQARIEPVLHRGHRCMARSHAAARCRRPRPPRRSRRSCAAARSKRRGRPRTISRRCRPRRAPGTPVYLSAVPTRPQEEVVAQAARVRAAGPRAGAASGGAQLRLAPTRSMHFLDRLDGEAGVRRLLVIAGDRAEPAGPFHGALEAIDSGLIARRGIRRSASRAIRTAIRASPTTSSTALLAAKLEAAAADRAQGRHRHAVLPRRRRRSSPGCGACAITASIIRCASGLPGRPA